MRLTVIGIGYKKNDITVEGYNAILAADTIIVKSSQYELPEVLAGRQFHTLDYIYESSENFSALDENLANEVMKLSKGNTVYLVSGNGISDYSLKLLKGYKLIKGVSNLPEGIHNSYMLMSAYEIAGNPRLNINTDIPLVITEIDNDMLAMDVKLRLLEIYREDAEIEINRKKDILENFDRIKKYGHSTYAVIYPTALIEKKRFNLNDLLKIMDILCAPEGCPWDRVQTHESIKINIIEEAYEAADAIDSKDIGNMLEEFGDLLLQAVFQSTIAERAGEFNINDVISELCGKLIYRHTHVFGNIAADNPADALKAWDSAKSKEKNQDTIYSAISALPKSFPSLLKAVKIQQKVKKGGMDFASFDDTLESLLSEIEEFKRAATYEEKVSEMGDILFSVCNAARFSGIEPETALNSSINKFSARFKYIEDRVLETGRKLNDLTPSELDELWQKSKKQIAG